MRVVEVISAMVEKELEQRNFGFDSLKSRLNRDMEEEGIIDRDCLPCPSTAGCSCMLSSDPLLAVEGPAAAPPPP